MAAGRAASTAARLVQLVERDATMFHAPDGVAYVRLQHAERFEVHPVRSGQFRAWLAKAFFDKTRGRRAPSSQTLQDALGVLEARALHDGEEHPVSVRLAESAGRLYVDLCDLERHVVEVSPDGWRVLDDPPVRFVRRRGMRALPYPARGGSINALRQFVNVRSEDDFRLLVGWLLQAARPRGPYAVLALVGGQGSAKSTTARVLRALLDPNEAPLRAAPREERDLAISAANAWAVCFDNVSRLPDWMSDAICRLATGGGFATRELYSDREETILNVQRPVLLNGIEEFVARGDLLDRTMLVYTPAIPDGARRSERTFWQEFEREA
ncbi:MAG: hypothetical protein HY608_04750, partial [Planctomycetes bacterium]|nr:hypothetical protein [Planctomycetota bacterium]